DLPEGHVHAAIQVDGGAQLGTGLLLLAGRGIQSTEAAVTVRHKRAHAEFLGQGQGLAVVGFVWRGLWGIAPRSKLAEEAQGIRLVATFLSLTSVGQRALGEGVRLLQAAG